MAYNNVKVKPRQTLTQSNTQSKDLGIVSEVPMGEWNATTSYQKLNKVRYVSVGGSGVTLLAKKQNEGVEPFVTHGWQEVWMVENYDGGAVSPDGTYPEMTVGNATVAQNDGNGENIVEQFADINDKIPSTASDENQLADKAFVNSSINNLAAFYIEYNIGGDAFPTRAALLNATTFYNAKQPRVPTQNDYAYVLSDESQPKDSLGNYPTTRYSYQGGTYPNGQWGFQYVVNNTSLTQAQVDAINSGITKELVDLIGAGNVLSVNGETGAVTVTPVKIGAVNKAGDTMTGNLTIQKQNGEVYVNLIRTDGDRRVTLDISENGNSRGVWDKQCSWLISADENKNILIGNGSYPNILRNQVWLERSSGDALYYAKRTDTGEEIRFGVGAGGTNRGIYDKTLAKWIFYTNGTNVYINDVPIPNTGKVITAMSNNLTASGKFLRGGYAVFGDSILIIYGVVSTSGDTAFTFPNSLEFANTNYTVVVSYDNATTTGVGAGVDIKNNSAFSKATNGFSLRGASSTSYNMSFIAIGQKG